MLAISIFSYISVIRVIPHIFVGGTGLSSDLPLSDIHINSTVEPIETKANSDELIETLMKQLKLGRY